MQIQSISAFQYFDYVLSTKLGAFHILKIDFEGVEDEFGFQQYNRDLAL